MRPFEISSRERRGLWRLPSALAGASLSLAHPPSPNVRTIARSSLALGYYVQADPVVLGGFCMPIPQSVWACAIMPGSSFHSIVGSPHPRQVAKWVLIYYLSELSLPHCRTVIYIYDPYPLSYLLSISATRSQLKGHGASGAAENCVFVTNHGCLGSTGRRRRHRAAVW